jgi:hypothetical protein
MPATDNETASAGLNYNIRIGTTPGGSDLLGPMANTSTGFRRIAKIGRVNNNRSITINTESFVGPCYWSVQAIDGSFAGSAFAAEATFEVEGFVEQTSISLTSVSDGSVSWGDYDNDGDLDILLTGSGISKIYKNNGNDSFSDISAGLTGVSASSVAWGDYDNNGYLDILLTGSGISKIYKNNGNYSFSDINAGLTGVSQGSVAWGDYDNDGDLDILLTGNGISKIYQNNGNDSFSDINAGLTGVTNSSAAWGDYDNDGDLDILLTGESGSEVISKIYKNNGSDSFADIGAGLPGVRWCSVAWGDYDNDGDLDILLTGQLGELNPGYISKIYKNNGNGSFTNIYAGLTEIWTGGSTAWGDYDNDGDLDIILTGQRYSAISKIYQNDGNDSFTDINAGLTGVSGSSVAWGDYDNDGDLDLLLSGDTGSGNVTKIYKNYRYTSNTIPSAPTNLSSSVNGDDVTFSWDAATDTETPSNGLKYKLCIGSSSGALDLLSPMSNTANGFNRNPSVGDIITGTSITIKDLPQNADIYWSLQTIDTGMKGSVFATEQGAHPLPVELTSFVALSVKNKVNLNWQTATEVNNYGFQVQRQKIKDKSENEWEDLGFVQGHGNSNSPKEYSFIDNDLPAANIISYRLKQIDNDGAFAYSKTIAVDLTSITSVDDEEIPTVYSLSQNYPNPFNPSTTINYSIPKKSYVTIKVYNSLGKLLSTLVNKEQSEGIYSINFDGSSLSSGVYLYKLVAEDYIATNKMILIK